VALFVQFEEFASRIAAVGQRPQRVERVSSLAMSMHGAAGGQLRTIAYVCQLIARQAELVSCRYRRQDDPAAALRAAELSARALSYGVRPEPSAVQVNINEHLGPLGEILVKPLQGKKAEAIEIASATA